MPHFGLKDLCIRKTEAAFNVLFYKRIELFKKSLLGHRFRYIIHNRTTLLKLSRCAFLRTKNANDIQCMQQIWCIHCRPHFKGVVYHEIREYSVSGLGAQRCLYHALRISCIFFGVGV